MVKFVDTFLSNRISEDLQVARRWDLVDGCEGTCSFKWVDFGGGQRSLRGQISDYMDEILHHHWKRGLKNKSMTSVGSLRQVCSCLQNRATVRLIITHRSHYT